MQIVNVLNADFHIFTGDFIDRGFPGVTDQVREVFPELKPAAIASLGCLGNHDYSHGWSQVDVADRVARTMSEFGVQILRDEWTRSEIQLPTRDNGFYSRESLTSALSTQRS